jgi:hypothetical protein
MLRDCFAVTAVILAADDTVVTERRQHQTPSLNSQTALAAVTRAAAAFPIDAGRKYADAAMLLLLVHADRAGAATATY